MGAGALSIAACASHSKVPPGASGPVAQQTAPPPEAGNQPGSLPSGPNPGSAQDFVITAGELVYFDLDKYDVRADATPILEAQSAWLRRYPQVRVRIEGNCDERGTREYNLALGARRANAVRDYLVGHGVATARIATLSYGKEQPIDPGADEPAWARNRNARTAITDGAR
jgi:peptidoglycan-associated lipoprotein